MLVCIRHIYHGRFHPIWKARRATKTAQTISVDAFRRIVALVSLWRPAKGRLRGLAADSQIEAEKLSRTLFKLPTFLSRSAGVRHPGGAGASEAAPTSSAVRWDAAISAPIG